MATLRAIAQLGAPVLRQQAAVITALDSPALQELLDDMLFTLEQSSGVGIAAPQVAEAQRAIIVASRPTTRYPNAPEMPATVMLNPSFTPLSTERHKDWEGCLSIPGIRALVPRYTAIQVHYTDMAGALQHAELTDFPARVFQHEYDHLEGMVYLDRVEHNRDIISETEFFKLIAAR